MKAWYLSKTIWVNIVLGLCAALVYALPALGGVAAWVSANTALIGMGWAALGVLLRFVSKDQIVLQD